MYWFSSLQIYNNNTYTCIVYKKKVITFAQIKYTISAHITMYRYYTMPYVKRCNVFIFSAIIIFQ